MRDFTLEKYKLLLETFLEKGYPFNSYSNFLLREMAPIVILRHDVDRLPEQALKMAKIEHELGIKASYYFRCHRRDFNETAVRSVAALGHEIGYHYEDLSRSQGNLKRVYAA